MESSLRHIISTALDYCYPWVNSYYIMYAHNELDYALQFKQIGYKCLWKIITLVKICVILTLYFPKLNSSYYYYLTLTKLHLLSISHINNFLSVLYLKWTTSFIFSGKISKFIFDTSGPSNTINPFQRILFVKLNYARLSL